MYHSHLFSFPIAFISAAALIASSLDAESPRWWKQQAVIVPNVAASDYSLINQGQLKHLAQAASNEMAAHLPGGAGLEVASLVQSWSSVSSAQSAAPEDYAPVNIGQLKAVAKVFYDRLDEAGYVDAPVVLGRAYPWTPATPALAVDDDYAYANIGQAKHLFSFDLATDSDADEMPDWWERSNGLNPHDSADSISDVDADKVPNWQEFLRGSNPNNSDSDGDGIVDGDTDGGAGGGEAPAPLLAALPVPAVPLSLVVVVLDQERLERGEITRSAIDYSRIELRWNSDGKNVSEFRVEKKVSTGEWKLFTRLAADTKKCQDSGLLANQNVGYRVAAINKSADKQAESEFAWIGYQVPFLKGLSLRMSSGGPQKPGMREFDTGVAVAVPKYYLNRTQRWSISKDLTIKRVSDSEDSHWEVSYSSDTEADPPTHWESFKQSFSYTYASPHANTVMGGTHNQILQGRSKVPKSLVQSVQREATFSVDGLLFSGAYGSNSYNGNYLLSSEFRADPSDLFWNGSDYDLDKGHFDWSGNSHYNEKRAGAAFGYTSNTESESTADATGLWAGNRNSEVTFYNENIQHESSSALSSPAWVDTPFASGFGIWNNPESTPTTQTYHYETRTNLETGSATEIGSATVTLKVEFTTAEYLDYVNNELPDWHANFVENFYGWGIYGWGLYDPWSNGSDSNGWWIAGRDLSPSEEYFSLSKSQYQFQASRSAPYDLEWSEVFVPEDNPDTAANESEQMKVVRQFKEEVGASTEIVPAAVATMDPMSGAITADGNYYIIFPPRLNVDFTGLGLDPVEKKETTLGFYKTLLYPESDINAAGYDPLATVQTVYQAYVTIDLFAVKGAKYQFTWAGAAFSLKLWTQDPDTKKYSERAIKNGDALTEQELRSSSRYLIFRADPALMTEAFGALKISATDSVGTAFGSDTIRAMFVPELLVDGNRDGVMSMDDDAIRYDDWISAGVPYRFWLNDDQDVGTTSFVWSDPDPETIPAKTPDYSDSIIQGTRDLEDFTRLWISFKGIAEAVKTSGVQLKFEWKPEKGGADWSPEAGSPGIKIYKALETDGGRKYIEDQTVATQQVAPPYDKMLVEVKKGASTVLSLSASTLANLSEKTPNVYLLFEGASEGRGQLVLTVNQGDKKLCTCEPLYLDIKNIKKMYVRANTTPLPAGFAMPYVQGTPPSSPYVASSNGALSIPRASMRYGLGNGEETPGNQAFDQPPDEENKCIIFVHGIDMDIPSYHCYSESGFKRLWWAGYKGRFSAFRWGTPLSGGFSADIFNDGEMRAWSYGPSLIRYVGYIGSQMPDARVSVIGHSLGNAVVGSAFERGLVVDSYVAMEAAVSLSCYFDAPAKNQPDALASSYLSALVSADAKSPTPDSYKDLGYRGFLRNLPSGCKNKLFAYQNQKDFWLATGLTAGGLIRVDWVNNQSRFKPNNLRGANVFKAYEFHPDRAAGLQCVLGVVGILNDRLVQSPYEAMAFVARSRTSALGAESPTGNPAPPHWKAMDMEKEYDFGGSRPDHSGQFQRDIQLMYAKPDGKVFTKSFYNRLIEDLNMEPK